LKGCKAMSRRIIVVYNSRDAALSAPQTRLLRTHLAEVEAEMRSGIKGRALDKLASERKLLRSKLGQNDVNEKYWSYQSSTATPSLEEAIELRAISANTTETQWHQLSPGMRREIVRSKQKKSGQDGVGTPEEQAYGEGWHSTENYCPYADPVMKASWEKGRAASRQKRKLNTNAHRGEVRGKRFEPPKIKVSADSKYSLITQEGMSGEPQVFYVNTKTSEIGPFKSRAAAERYVDEHPKLKPPSAGRDYKSEKGFVAKLIDVQSGATLARSEPHISNGLGLKKWVQEEAAKLIKRGKRVKAEVAVVFFDPNMA
jgi:hypothetical protein